jgi:hypothetical protein
LTSNTLEFVSRSCKQGPHSKCHESWTGLGFIMTCNCICHRKNMGQLEVVGPEDNAISINSSSKEAAKDLPKQDANKQRMVRGN